MKSRNPGLICSIVPFFRYVVRILEIIVVDSRCVSPGHVYDCQVRVHYFLLDGLVKSAAND